MSRFFLPAVLFEGSLVATAVVSGWLVGLDPWVSWNWGVRGWVWGVIGVLPPLVMLAWVMRSGWGPVREMRERMEPILRGVFAGWRWWELVVLSVVAGLGEEVLFRGVVQAWLEVQVGWWGALVLAAILFGFMHPITRLYVVLAAVMGVWFGLVWLWGGSLWAPVLAHGLYDAIALMVCVRGLRRGGWGMAEGAG